MKIKILIGLLVSCLTYGVDIVFHKISGETICSTLPDDPAILDKFKEFQLFQTIKMENQEPWRQLASIYYKAVKYEGPKIVSFAPNLEYIGPNGEYSFNVIIESIGNPAFDFIYGGRMKPHYYTISGKNIFLNKFCHLSFYPEMLNVCLKGVQCTLEQLSTLEGFFHFVKISESELESCSVFSWLNEKCTELIASETIDGFQNIISLQDYLITLKIGNEMSNDFMLEVKDFLDTGDFNLSCEDLFNEFGRSNTNLLSMACCYEEHLNIDLSKMLIKLILASTNFNLPIGPVLSGILEIIANPSFMMGFRGTNNELMEIIEDVVNQKLREIQNT